MHTAERLVPESSSFEVEIAIDDLKKKKCKSRGVDQTPSEVLLEAIGEVLL
jgi:hypothetical protein